MGLEALGRANPSRVLRNDDDLDALTSRSGDLGVVEFDVSSLAVAWPRIPSRYHGDALMLCAGCDRAEGYDFVLNELTAGTDWTELASTLLLWRASVLQGGPSQKRSLLEAALIQAMEHWDLHQLKPVLTAAAILAPTASAPLSERLEDREAPGSKALRRHVRQSADDAVRLRLVRLLGVRGLAESAINGLEDLRGSQLDGVLSRDGCLLAAPGRMRRLARSRLGVRLAGRLSGRIPMPVTTARSLSRVLARCLKNPDQLARKLGCLANHPDRLAGILATAELIRLPVNQPARNEVLEELSHSASESTVARLAGSAGDGFPVMKAFRTIQAFAASLESAPPWRCASYSLVHHDRDPDALAHVLRTTLQAGSIRARMAALEVIDRRRLVPSFEREIIELVSLPARGGSIAIASRALGLLSLGPTGRSARIIVRSLASIHPELQVRALEAATSPKATPAVQTGCALVDEALLERLARAADRRVRAGALRALEHRSHVHARRVVEALLVDEDLEHRLSGLDGVRATADPSLRSSVLRMMEREDQQVVMVEGRDVLKFLESRGPTKRQPSSVEVIS
ncbi:MAG: hypothetical protein P8J45_14820 [Phycisphaerales bacterium]|nr:hypothetical protein [Phycisphaerales bacterium]